MSHQQWLTQLFWYLFWAFSSHWIIISSSWLTCLHVFMMLKYRYNTLLRISTHLRITGLIYYIERIIRKRCTQTWAILSLYNSQHRQHCFCLITDEKFKPSVLWLVHVEAKHSLHLWLVLSLSVWASSFVWNLNLYVKFSDESSLTKDKTPTSKYHVQSSPVLYTVASQCLYQHCKAHHSTGMKLSGKQIRK